METYRNVTCFPRIYVTERQGVGKDKRSSVPEISCTLRIILISVLGHYTVVVTD